MSSQEILRVDDELEQGFCVLDSSSGSETDSRTSSDEEFEGSYHPLYGGFITAAQYHRLLADEELDSEEGLSPTTTVDTWSYWDRQNLFD